MRFPSVIRDERHTLEFILRGLSNQLTASDNFQADGTTGQVLTSNGPNSPPSWQDTVTPIVPGDIVTGTGTPGTIPKWLGPNQLTNSTIVETNALVTVNNALSVNGASTLTGAVTMASTLGVTGATTLQGGLLSSQGANATTTLLAPSNPITGKNDWVLVGSGSAGLGSVAIGSVVRANIYDVVIGSGAANSSTTASPYGAVVIGNSTQLSTDSGVAIGAAISPSSSNIFDGVAIGASIALPPGLGIVTTFVGVGNDGVFWTPTNPNQCSIVALGDGNAFDLAAPIAVARGVAVGTNNTVRHNNVAILGYGITSTAANTTYIGGTDNNTPGVGTSTVVFGAGDAIAAAYAPVTLRLTNAVGTDLAGADLILQGGLGTGAGASAAIRLRASTPLGSGTTLQTAADVLVASAGAVAVTGTLTASSTVQGTQLISTVVTGTAPLVVASTTAVANLTATNLGASGQNAAFFQSSSNQTAGTLADARLSTNVDLLNGIQTISAVKTFSAAPAFTAAGAPFSVSSTTVVANLHATNSDQLGGTVAASYALLASPTFTGTPAAPTATLGTNTTQLATTAFVQSAIGAYTPPVTSVFGRTGAVVATTGDYAFSNISGTIASGQVSGSYTGITGVGTLAAGAVPASLVTAGTFGAGDYAFPARLSINTAVSTSVLLAVSGVHPSSSTAPTGVYNSFVIPSTATGTSTYYRASPATQVASYTANTVIGFWISPPTVNAGSSISSLYGFRADNQGAAGITTSYAFYAAAQSGSTNPWSFYSAGGGNFFTGPLSIYNNSGATNTDVLLRIGTGGAHPSASTSIFGSTTDLGVPATGTTAIGYFARWRTVASAFTASVLEGFRAETFILGAGSSVTTLVGFRVNTQSITTSNSYGLLVADITGGTSGNYAVYTSAGIVSIGDQLVSRVASGTAPFVVASTDLVTNLNADLLDGQHGSYYSAWANLTGTPTTLAGYGITDAAPLSAITGTVNTIPVWATSTTFGNSLLSQDAGATTVTVAGRVAIAGALSPLIFNGNPANGLQLLLGGSGAYGSIGTRASVSPDVCIAYNASQTTNNTDAWAQSSSTLGSLLLRLGAGTLSFYNTTAGRTAGTFAAFWGTSVASFDTSGALTIKGLFTTGTGIFFATDNANDIGLSSIFRPRTGYFGTSVVSPRYYTSGTALATTDYALSSGWGTSPTKAVAGTDIAGTITITAKATTSANPTVTLTFKGGTFTTIPVVVACRGDVAAPTTCWWAVTSVTATQVVFTFVGTPTALNVYILKWLVLSN